MWKKEIKQTKGSPNIAVYLLRRAVDLQHVPKNHEGDLKKKTTQQIIV